MPVKIPKISVTTSTRAKVSVRKRLKIRKKIKAVVMLNNIQIRAPPDNKTAGQHGTSEIVSNSAKM